MLIRKQAAATTRAAAEELLEKRVTAEVEAYMALADQPYTWESVDQGLHLTKAEDGSLVYVAWKRFRV